MGVWQKCSRTQGSKKILRETSEGRLRRNGKVKKNQVEEEDE